MRQLQSLRPKEVYLLQDRRREMSTISEPPQTPSVTPQSAIDDQISFVLSNPRMSAWLKTALSEALLRDPISVLNDLEILNLILRTRSELLIAESYDQSDS